jgi:hypothetical protein
MQRHTSLLAAVAAFVFLLASAMPVMCEIAAGHDKAVVLTMLVQPNMPAGQQQKYFEVKLPQAGWNGKRVLCFPMYRCQPNEKKLDCVPGGEDHKPLCRIDKNGQALVPGGIVSWAVAPKLAPSEPYTLVGSASDQRRLLACLSFCCCPSSVCIHTASAHVASGVF